MKTAIAALAGASLVLATGCSTIRDELRYPSGAPGRLLDKRTFDASESKQLALLRATLALAIAARMGEGSVSTADADVFARQLAEAANEINYAAVDAGFPAPPITVDGEQIDRSTCAISRASDEEFITGDFVTEDARCSGYYVNFEANIARIESRIIRAMLTSLPTDRARRFLEQLSKGDLLSALWSLARTGGDLAGAFHRGAGVYRAGLENVAAQVSACEYKPGYDREDYDQATDTVFAAAACLGLSHENLFTEDDISANDLPDKVDPKAFLALFRIVRTSCVALPMASIPSSAERFDQDRINRSEACSRLRFDPNPRQDTIVLKTEETGDDAEAADADDPNAGEGRAQASPPPALAPPPP